MSYIGSTPTTAAFPFDQFSGDGTTTAFTLTYAPASTTSIVVAISGVVQNPNLYSVVGTTLTFSPAPPSGTSNIAVLYLGLPVITGSSPGNTAFLSATDLTATASQTVFASAGSYTPGFVQVYRNGARLGNADFTATNGTTITLASAATSGDLVTIEYYTLTSLTNALPLTGGTVTGSTTFNTGVNLAAVSGNVGIGVTPSAWVSTFSALQVKNAFIAGFSNRMYVGANNYFDGSNNRYIATDFATRYYQLNGIHAWEVAASGTAGNAITFTEVLAVEKDKSLALQGATTQTGTGITFPATQSASTNANTLDDYEEGTWTPAFVPASGSITISTSFNTGRYTKVGRLVTVNLHARFTSVSSPSGSLAITGLPFTSSATGQQDRNAGAVAAIAVTTSATPITAYITDNVTQITLTGFVAASGGYANAATYINASSELYMTVTYYV